MQGVIRIKKNRKNNTATNLIEHVVGVVHSGALHSLGTDGDRSKNVSTSLNQQVNLWRYPKQQMHSEVNMVTGRVLDSCMGKAKCNIFNSKLHGTILHLFLARYVKITPVVEKC